MKDKSNRDETILKHTYHHEIFSDKKKLVELKEKQNLKISLAFPTLNEENTIGKEILVIKTELVDRFPLLDEIAVIDSGSTDATRDVAASFGADVYLAGVYDNGTRKIAAYWYDADGNSGISVK